MAFALPLTIIAQEDSASASDVEEVVVVGSQIIEISYDYW